MWRTVLAICVVLCLAGAGATSRAQPAPYPTHPLTIVMGASRGGITDVIARLYADAVAKDLGQPILIDNRPSASGADAAAYVQRAAPDGYTLLAFQGAQHAALPAMRRVDYEPVDGFAPVTTLFTLVNFLAVPAASAADSVADLLLLGQMKQGGLLFGSSGLGTASHLTAAGMVLSTRTPIESRHYAGAAPMTADLVAGRLDFALVSATAAKPYVDAGRLRLLAVDAEDRWPDLPALPTLREAGVEQPKVASWFALAAPKGTPAPTIARLYEAFAKAARDPAVARGLRDNGALAGGATPEETRALMQREAAAVAGLVRNSNLR